LSVSAVRILILRPGAPSVALNLRKRWLAATFPLLVAAPWMAARLATPGKPPASTQTRDAASNQQERQRLANLGRKLSLLEQHLDRLGIKAPSDSGNRGGPELPITLASLEQDVAALHGKVQDLSNHREALSAQLRRRFALEVPQVNLPIGPPMRAAFDYTSGFGVRADPWTGAPTAHNGIDLAADYGATVVANAPGRVVSCENTPGYGLMLELDHGGGLTTRYGHLSACRVQVGDRVGRDQPIAAVGNSGRSTGPHLHYEVLVKGRAIDPAPLVWLLPTSPS
jgi:murein DD-endopeptidase MepM/ murein hydrolase activator NlpD